MSFLSGLFSGSGGNTSTQNTNYNSTTKNDIYQPYMDFANGALSKAAALQVQPWQGYDVSNFGDMSNDTQQQAWDQTGALQGSWTPYFNQAQSTLDQYGNTSKSAYDRASASPTALQAAQPYTDKAGQSWTDVSSSYLNPYINDTVTSANDLTNKNFLENILPKLQASYAASGGGLGSKDYGRDMNWALTNFNDSTNRTTQAALADAYNKSAGIFENDASRYAGLSGTVGNQATNDINSLTGLGASSSNAGTTQANAYGQLGTNDLNNNLQATNALLQTGNQQQEIENWKNQYKADQFKESVQWPYQTNSWAADTVNKYQWPTTQTSSGNSTTTGTSGASSSNSPFSTILGGLSAVGSLSNSNLFGGLFGGASTGTGTASTGAKRGGSFNRITDHKPRAFARGGYLGMDTPSSPPFNFNPGYFKWMDSTAFANGGPVHFDGGGKVGGILGSILGSLGGSFFGGPIGGMAGNKIGGMLGGLLPFAAGGHAPVVKATRQQDDRRLSAARARQMQPQGGLRRQLVMPSPAAGFFGGA